VASLLDSGLTMMCHQITAFCANGTVPEQMGSGISITAPYEAFKTADGWVMIAAGNDKLFSKLSETLGLPEAADEPAFKAVKDRVANRARLQELLEQRLREASTADWITRLGAAGIPAGPVNDVGQAVAHQVVADRSLLTHPVGGNERLRLVR